MLHIIMRTVTVIKKNDAEWLVFFNKNLIKRKYDPSYHTEIVVEIVCLHSRLKSCAFPRFVHRRHRRNCIDTLGTYLKSALL